MFRKRVRANEPVVRCCQPRLEELEDRRLLSSVSVFQFPNDAVKFVSDLSTGALTAVQAGIQVARGVATHNAAEYYQGVREYQGAVAEVVSDYQQLENDLSLLNNVQAGISSLPTAQRMKADVYAMFEGGLITVYGGLTLNQNVMNQGFNFAKNAANDYISAIEQAFGNYSSGIWSSQDQYDSGRVGLYGQ